MRLAVVVSKRLDSVGLQFSYWFIYTGAILFMIIPEAYLRHDQDYTKVHSSFITLKRVGFPASYFQFNSIQLNRF